MNLPVRYTEQDVARAKKSGRFVGWIQGGAVVLAGGMVLNLIGWIPTVLVVGGVAYLGYRMLTRSSDES